ncbi:MAG: hypothetical protein J6B81_05785, partial [Spirochaetaceae bacterium]|nr:hypothetical protein [Spirochaetaceae bacterium]
EMPEPEEVDSINEVPETLDELTDLDVPDMDSIVPEMPEPEEVDSINEIPETLDELTVLDVPDTFDQETEDLTAFDSRDVTAETIVSTDDLPDMGEILESTDDVDNAITEEAIAAFQTESIPDLDSKIPATLDELPQTIEDLPPEREITTIAEEKAEEATTEFNLDDIPDMSSFSDGEISLDAFFSDSPSKTESVDISDFGDGEISLDSFFDGDGGESISLEDFMPSEKKEKNDILNDPPMDIQLSFDDDFALNTRADPVGQMESFGDDISIADFASDGGDFDFDAMFDNITDESQSEITTEVDSVPSNAIQMEEVNFDEVTEFDDLLGSIEQDSGPAPMKSSEESSTRNKVIDYDITVSMDDNDVQEVKSIQTDTDDDDSIDDISLYMEPDSEISEQNKDSTLDRTQKSEYNGYAADDDFDLDKIMSEVEDIGGGEMQTDASNDEKKTDLTELSLQEPEFTEPNDIFSDDFFDTDPIMEPLKDIADSDDTMAFASTLEIPETFSEEISEEFPLEDSTVEITEEPIFDEVTPEISEEPIFDEVAPEISEEPIFDEVAPEISEEPIFDEVAPEISEEPIFDEVAPEISEEPIFDEVAPEISEEPIFDEVAPEISEEPIFDEVAPEISEEPAFFTEENTELEIEPELEITEEPVFEEPTFATDSINEKLADETVTDEAYMEEDNAPIPEQLGDETHILEEDSMVDETAPDILKNIAGELATLRQEISALKNDFENLKMNGIVQTGDVVQEENSESAFFAGNTDDDTIALSGDELSNILNTADFTEEEAESEANSTDVQQEESTEEVPEDNLYAGEDSDNGLPPLDFEGEKLEEPEIDDLELDIAPEEELPEEIEIPITEEIVAPSPAEEALGFVADTGFDAEDMPDEVLPSDVDLAAEETLEEDNIFGDEFESSPVEEVETNEAAEDDVFGFEPDQEDIVEETDEPTEEVFKSEQWQEDTELEAATEEDCAEETVAEEVTVDEADDIFAESDETALLDEVDAAETTTEEESTEETVAEEVTVDEADDIFAESDETALLDEVDVAETTTEEESTEETIAEEVTVDKADDIFAESDETALLDEVDVAETTTEEESTEETVAEEVTVDKADVSLANDNTSSIPEDLKRDIKSVLSYMDQLLDNLPEEKIAEFARSEHFELYKKLFVELGLS